MATYFRINNDKTVNVLKTIFSKKISSEEFEDKSKKVDFSDFVMHFEDKVIREKLTLEMMKLSRADNFSMIGPVMEKNDKGEICPAGCYIGDCYFEGYYTSSDARDAAIKYGYDFYGKEKMDKLINQGVLQLPENVKEVESPTVFVKYYINDEEISEEDYSQINQMFIKLRRIRNANHPLDTERDVAISKR